MNRKYNFKDNLLEKVAQMEEDYSFQVDEDYSAYADDLHTNELDDGAYGKRVDEVIRATVMGVLEYCHGANRSDISLRAKKKAVEVKTGRGELSPHYRSKAEAEQALAEFLAGGKLLKTRGYIIYQPIANQYDLGSAVVYPVEKFERLLRDKTSVVVKQATYGYWVISIQSYTTSKKGYERFLGWYAKGEIFSDWLFKVTGQY